jgi:hypothetical protein
MNVSFLALKEVVEELVDRLGLKLTALIGGATETRSVRAWITGQEPQYGGALRAAPQVTRVICQSLRQ